MGVTVIELLGSSELLDGNKTEQSGSNKEESYVAEILVNLNEKLAVRNMHRKKIIKIIKIVFLVIAVLLSIPILYSLFWMYIAATM